MPHNVQATGGTDLRRLWRDLRAQADGKARQKALRKELRDTARPLVPAVRTAIKNLPSQGESRRRGRASLRAEMARTVTLQLRMSGRRAGVSVFMNPRKMGDGRKALPAYFEGTPGYTRFRHPVFGTDAWVTQVRRADYFTRTVRRAETATARQLQRIVDRVAQEIEDG